MTPLAAAQAAQDDVSGWEVIGAILLLAAAVLWVIAVIDAVSMMVDRGLSAGKNVAGAVALWTLVLAPLVAWRVLRG